MLDFLSTLTANREIFSTPTLFIPHIMILYNNHLGSSLHPRHQHKYLGFFLIYGQSASFILLELAFTHEFMIFVVLG